MSSTRTRTAHTTTQLAKLRASAESLVHRWPLSPTLSVLFGGIILLLVNLLAAYHIRAYTSDDVVWQNALLHWRPFHGSIYLSDASVSYIAKAPLYWVISLVFSPGRRALLGADIIFSVGNFILFYWSALYFWKKWGVSRKWQNLLPMFWFASLGFGMSSLFLATNLHNIEIGVIFFVFALTANILYGEFKPLQSPKNILISIFGAAFFGAMLANDQYLLFFCAGPIVVLLVYEWARAKTDARTLLSIAGILLLSLVWLKLINKFAAAAGVQFLPGVATYFIPVETIQSDATAAFRSLFIMFGADIWGRAIAKLTTVLTAINVLALSLSIWAVVHSFRATAAKSTRKTQSLVHLGPAFYGMLFVFVPSVYIASGLAVNATTYRYLIPLPFIAALLLPLLFKQVTGRPRMLVNIVLIASILCGVVSSVVGMNNSEFAAEPFPYGNLYPYSTTGRANSQNYALVQLLASHKLQKGYGSYWDANINTYLSKGDISFLPTICSPQGETEKFYWLIDMSQFNRPAARSFYVYNPTQAGLHYNCTPEQMTAQFGQPAEQLRSGDDTIFIYNYDITSKITTGIYNNT